MTGCDLDVVLYFYGEMDAAAAERAAAHLHICAECRQRLEELHAIRRALADRPPVDAPPARDWSGFMRRLDAAVARAGDPASDVPSRPEAVAARAERRTLFTAGLRARQIAGLAAMLALVTIGVFAAARFRGTAPSTPAASTAPPAAPAPVTSVADGQIQSLREGSVEHLERSKLVVLGLTTRDPEQTTADDWQYERRLAGTLLSDTRLYRMAAQDRGVADVARVMRDLETVLLEASLSDSSDRAALERLQRLIAKRDLVMKMQVISTGGPAGI